MPRLRLMLNWPEPNLLEESLVMVEEAIATFSWVCVKPSVRSMLAETLSLIQSLRRVLSSSLSTE